MKTSGKKDMDYLELGTTKETPDNPDHGKQMDMKKQKSLKTVIAILKSRKAKK